MQTRIASPGLRDLLRDRGQIRNSDRRQLRAECQSLHDADRDAHTGERAGPAAVGDAVQIAPAARRLPAAPHRPSAARDPRDRAACRRMRSMHATVDAQRDGAAFGRGIDGEQFHASPPARLR